MTEEELKKVPFRETCHMAMEGEYTTTYMSKDGRLGFCDHVPRDKYGMVKTGGHSFFAEDVVDNNLTDEERMQLATATLLGGCATTAAAIVIAIVLCLLFCSCATTRYVPVNETRTEHHWHTDSVHQTDTIINRETTVIRELDSAAMARYGIQIGAMQRAWLVQSDRLQREVARLETLSQQRDTVRDSIPKPYPVEVIKQVPRDLTLWQRIRQSVGGFAIFLLLIFVGCKIFVKFLPDFHNPNSKE